MKNIFLLLLLITGMVKAQIVNFPDANFKLTLLSITPDDQKAYGNGGYIAVDGNNDGEIQVVEAQAIDSLRLDIFSSDEPSIADLTGIASFSNLKKLTCLQANTLTNVTGLSSLTSLKHLELMQNNLTTLDVSMLTNLEYLRTDFSTNLSSINVSGLANLKTFTCDGDALTSLNLSGLVNLRDFSCSNNQLTSIDVNGSPNLYFFLCGSNQITSLDVSNLTNLVFLQCYYNQITSLTLNNLPSLGFLDVGGNELTTLDLSQFGNLNNLSCESNQLTNLDCSSNPISQLYCINSPLLQTLNIKNGTSGLDPDFSGCTSLSFICADEAETVLVSSAVVAAGLTGVVVNSYCSFVSGGNYNTISGNIRFDANNTGCDATDLPQPNIRVNIDDGDDTGASFSSSTGNYAFFTQAGSFDITPSIENASWFTFSPTTATVNFADNNNNTAIQDFCIAPIGFHPDVEVVISPVFFARPGFDATYQITYRNKGNQTISGIVNLIFDDSRTDFVSANPSVDNLAVNSLSWNYNNLLPFESRIITVVLNVNSPTETPAVNIDDILNFEASISPVVSDENPLDNIFLYNQTVVGSYDPNDITCLEGAVVPPSEIGNYLHYVINFENTGTFPAENVVVKTEIDAAKFDIGSLQLMNSNFAVDARITGNKVECIFENIQLPIGGHGHVLLKVRTQNSLVTGDAVANRGDIYFDYNFPIDTGLANTVFQTLSNSVFEIDNSVVIYPNPANNVVTIMADNKIRSIELYDAQGRIILTSLKDALESKLDISSYVKGIYFLKISTEKGAQIQKLLKD